MNDDTARFISVIDRLAAEYPQTPSLIHYRTPFELLVGVILSAQTTDQAVNEVLPELVRRFPDAAALAGASTDEVETIIHRLGFFRRKAKSITRAAAALEREHGGEVPPSMQELTSLPGVGRKSAGVLLLHLFDTPAIIVDTHFGRVTRRLGFSGATQPDRIERDVARLLPVEYWNPASMRLNYHGRRYCFARRPNCKACPVRDLCPAVGVER